MQEQDYRKLAEQIEQKLEQTVESGKEDGYLIDTDFVQAQPFLAMVFGLARTYLKENKSSARRFVDVFGKYAGKSIQELCEAGKFEDMQDFFLRVMNGEDVYFRLGQLK